MATNADESPMETMDLNQLLNTPVYQEHDDEPGDPWNIVQNKRNRKKLDKNPFSEDRAPNKSVPNEKTPGKLKDPPTSQNDKHQKNTHKNNNETPHSHNATQYLNTIDTTPASDQEPFPHTGNTPSDQLKQPKSPYTTHETTVNTENTPIPSTTATNTTTETETDNAHNKYTSTTNTLHETSTPTSYPIELPTTENTTTETTTTTLANARPADQRNIPTRGTITRPCPTRPAFLSSTNGHNSYAGVNTGRNTNQYKTNLKLDFGVDPKTGDNPDFSKKLATVLQEIWNVDNMMTIFPINNSAKITSLYGLPTDKSSLK